MKDFTKEELLILKYLFVQKFKKIKDGAISFNLHEIDKKIESEDIFNLSHKLGIDNAEWQRFR